MSSRSRIWLPIAFLPLLGGNCKDPSEVVEHELDDTTARYEVTLDTAWVEIEDGADQGLAPGTPLANLVFTVNFFDTTLALDSRVYLFAGKAWGDPRSAYHLPGRLAYDGVAGLTQGDSAAAHTACGLPLLADVKNNTRRIATVAVPLTFISGAGPLAAPGSYVAVFSTRISTPEQRSCRGLFRTQPQLRLRVVASPPPPPPPGTSITWTGAAGTSDWRTAGNWNLNRTPEPADDVTIGGGAQVTLPGDTQSPDVAIERLLLSGELSVVGGASLKVAEDIAGPSGTLRVSGMDAGGRGTFDAIGTDSSLGTLELSGRIESSGGPPPQGQTWDDMPKLEVGTATFAQPGGSFLPTARWVQLVVTGSGTVDGGFNPSDLSTLEVAAGAQLTVSGGTSSTIGLGSPFIGNGRLINRGTFVADLQGITINSRLENHGTITLQRNAAFTARGENRGAIRSQGTLGPATLTFQGRSGSAPHWIFGTASIIESSTGGDLRRVTVQAASVIDGLVRADHLYLDDAPSNQRATHVLAATQFRLDTLTAAASVVELSFGGGTQNTLAVGRLVVADTLRLPEFGAVGTNVMTAAELSLQFGSVLEGEVLQAGDVQLGPGGPTAPITLDGRLWITGTASAVNVTVVGKTGWLELRGGALDLNPGASNAIELRPERPGVSSDLILVNNGTIQKRGAGPAAIRACFASSGSGTITNASGATPVVIEQLLPCS